MSSRVKRVARTIWVLAGLAFTAWLAAGFQAADLPPGATTSDDRVAVVTTERGMDFRPRGKAQESGVIFLPGGMVEPLAYAPLMKTIAAAGFPAQLVYLPMRCACTDSQRGQLFERIRAIAVAEPQIAWSLAGHSRGGMLASRFFHESDVPLAGLILIGTTHPRDFSLASVTVPVTRIYGTRDGIAPYERMRENSGLLPASTKWVRIEGGNHIQFGYYRHQPGDDEAAMSREEQQRQVAKAMIETLTP